VVLYGFAERTRDGRMCGRGERGDGVGISLSVVAGLRWSGVKVRWGRSQCVKLSEAGERLSERNAGRLYGAEGRGE
jgi:hypothetical protein